MRLLNTPGLNGTTIHDIFDTTVPNYNFVSGTTAAVCATTFSSACRIVPSTAISSITPFIGLPGDMDSNVTINFKNGMNAKAFYAGGFPIMQIIPSPVMISAPCQLYMF
jgi:hypothetical protein